MNDEELATLIEILRDEARAQAPPSANGDSTDDDEGSVVSNKDPLEKLTLDYEAICTAKQRADEVFGGDGRVEDLLKPSDLILIGRNRKTGHFSVKAIEEYILVKTEFAELR